jgi:hypothetical protein
LKSQNKHVLQRSQESGEGDMLEIIKNRKKGELWQWNRNGQGL